MRKQDLKNSLLDYNSGKPFITTRKVRDWLGVGHNAAVDLLKGLPSVCGKFFIPDVVRRLEERTVIKWEE